MRFPRGWRVIALLAVLTLVAAGCGKDDKAASGGDGQTFKVLVDPKPDEFNASFIHYFPDTLKAHPGDTVQFAADFTGEPHTVSAGSMLKPLLDLAEKYKDTEPPPEAEEEFNKAFSAIPQTFDPGQMEATGDPFVQAGWEPCFYATGKPPIDKACDAEHQKQPATFNGKEVLYNAGFMDKDKDPFEVKLADDIAAGSYIFMCMFHGPEMTTTVEVVDKDTKVPEPSAVSASGQKQLDEFIGQLKPAADKVRNTTSPTEATAGADFEGEDGPPGSANVFPANITVKSGQSVTWSGIGFHTVSFNTTEDMRPAFAPKDGKGLHLNQKAFKPLNSPDYPPDPENPPDEGAPEPKLNGGTFTGTGIHHSGINLGEATYAYTLTFSKPGTYEYLCVVHPDMEGKVTVT